MLLALTGLASACGTNDGVKQTIAMVGSDTTQDVMNDLANQYNNDNGYNPSHEDDNQNVLAISATSPDPGHTVASDGVTTCPTKTYRTPTSVATEVTRPNGSGAGRERPARLSGSGPSTKLGRFPG